MISKEQRVGLVLSGGTLKGAAHVGAIAALEQLGVPIHYIAGTSAGSLVGSLYAHGYTSEEMHELVQSFPGVKLLDYGFPISSHLWYHTLKRFKRRSRPHVQKPLSVGLLRGRKLQRYVDKLLSGRTPRLPYFVVATDLNSGNPVIFSNDEKAVQEGRAHPITEPSLAVEASCALPGIFRSVAWHGHLLADGAIRHYAPVHVLQEAGCTKVIVVNLLTLDRDWHPMTVLDVVNRSFEILLRETIDDDVSDEQDVILIEPDLAHVTWTSISELEACYVEGRHAVFGKTRELTQLFDANSAPQALPSLSINQVPIRR